MIDEEIGIRIDREFDCANANIVKCLFQELNVPECQRVIKVILDRSKGDVESVRSFVNTAKNDYRDVLVAEASADPDNKSFSIALILGFMFVSIILLKSCISHS